MDWDAIHVASLSITANADREDVVGNKTTSADREGVVDSKAASAGLRDIVAAIGALSLAAMTAVIRVNTIVNKR